MTPPLPVRWTLRALSDLYDIRDYIAADKPMAAERMKRRLIDVRQPDPAGNLVNGVDS